MQATSLSSLTATIAYPLPTRHFSNHHLIQNETKEVLLRMFEHLIAKEQSHAAAANAIKNRRLAKAAVKNQRKAIASAGGSAANLRTTMMRQ